ncbi:ATP-binding protein [Pseudonocardia sp. MH-G8]|uniref:ATP-binding protein n=1 Tax=Pseudonocardia sp. MH-G8 TaxID=1854588 RepID=UPI00117B677B|nr:ATP-binding protein [Pseudonocardia sp. MH-G8]
MPRPLGWLRARMGVRAVSALSAAVVVALALLVAGAALLLLLQQSLRASVEAEAVQQAGLITTRLDQNWQGSANENAREALSALTRESEDLAQVIVEYGDTPQRTLEAGTDPLGGYRDGAPPISDIRPDDGETVVRTDVPVRKVDGSVVDAVLVATAGQSAGNDVVVLYAAPLTAVDHTTGTLLFYLLFGVPLLIVVAGLTTYLFSGRALRPVEAIRAQVAEMTEKDLGQRVPVPPSRDEVGRLAETMNGMIARLEDAQGVQRRFVADASHELRSPLATIATGLELMQSGTVDRSTITALRGETTRLNKLVEALILLARADERGLQPRREEVDLDEVAEGERGRPADGKVVAEVRTVPVRVVGDRGQLARVVRNLVDNARRHARSHVLVTVGQHDGKAVLEVSDDGPGVPPADRGRVFERFVRLDDARARSDGGSGLGLAIVAEVVAAHGGSVEVTDAPSGGALFRVRLPVAAAPESESEPGPEPDEAPVPVAAPSPRPAASTGPARASQPAPVGPAATSGPAAGAAPAGEPAPAAKPAAPVAAGSAEKPSPARKPAPAPPAGARKPVPAENQAPSGTPLRPASQRGMAPQGRPSRGTPQQGTPPRGTPPRGTPTPGTPPQGVPARRDSAGAAPAPPARPASPRPVTRWSAPPWSASPRQASPLFASPRPGNGRPAADRGSAQPANGRSAAEPANAEGGSRAETASAGGRSEPVPSESDRASVERANGHVPPAEAGTGPVPQPRDRVQRPVRDDEARRDPATAPYGVPAVPPGERTPDPARRDVPERRRQPGSAIR